MSKLIGPVRLVEYKDPDRHIYFFGDIHRNEPKCTTNDDNKSEIQDFLEYILKENGDKIIDFFLETHSIEGGVQQYFQEGKYKNYLDKVTDKFIECFKVDKKNCSTKYPNLRAHYIDRRQENQFINIKLLTIIQSSTIQAINSDFNDTGLIIPENEKKEIMSQPQLVEKMKQKIYRKLIYSIYMKNQLSSRGISNDILTIFTNPIGLLTKIKFYKQLENIQDKKTSEFIKDYFENKLVSFPERTSIEIFLKKFLSPYSKSGDDTEGNKPIYNGLDYSVIEFYMSKIIQYCAYYMDAYTIARLVRDYDKPKAGREKGEKAKYIMIYAGDAHINRYIEFFSEYNSAFGIESTIKEKTSNVIDSNYQCIDLSEFKLPFFKN